MVCKICETRKARRYCPGVQGDICSICCGTQREVTVNCPLDCTYLREARLHEKEFEATGPLPNADIELPKNFLADHEALIFALGLILQNAVRAEGGVVDSDVREAVDGLTQTYRTLTKGLYFESRPVNPFANRIYSAVRTRLGEYAGAMQEAGKAVRDSDILGALIFFQRVGIRFDNGRPKGRWFIEFLMRQFEAPEQDVEPPPSLIEL